MTEARHCLACGAPLVLAVLEGVERRRCSRACGFVHYGNPTPVVAAIVQHGDSVILARNHGWPESMHGLVSGFLEAGETPEQGVLREVREELLVEGALVALIGVYAFTMRNELIVAYHVRIEDEPRVGPELASIKRIPIAKLRPWPMGTGEAVRDWLSRVRPSPT